MTSSEWLAQLPAGTPSAFRPDVVRRMCDLAIVDAQALTQQIKISFAGTLPPPPWPATPELLDAIKRLRTIGDGLEVLERRGVKTLAAAKIPRLRAATAKAGSDLYAAMDELERRWRSGRTLQSYVAKASELASSGPLLLIAGLLWLDNRRG